MLLRFMYLAAAISNNIWALYKNNASFSETRQVISV
jgi:hypothetical protein